MIAEMAPEIGIYSWEEMCQFLTYEGYAINALTGAGVLQAAAKLGYTFWGSDTGVNIFIKSAASGAYPAIEDLTATGAKAAFDSYVTSGGGILRNGAAAIAQKAGNIALGLKEGVTTALGVLATPLPTAFAALAPFAGIAAGIGLYNLNPDFWEKMSRTLLPWIWEDIDQIGNGQGQFVKSFMDASGTLYYPREAISALSRFANQYRQQWQGYASGTFQVSHGTIGAETPWNSGLCVWENPEIGTELIDGMTLRCGDKSVICYITETPEGYETDFEGTFISFYDTRRPPAQSRISTDFKTGILLDGLTRPESDEFLKTRWIWHPLRWTIEIKWYLVEIQQQFYVGVEIANGDNPWPPNIEWQPGRYIINSPITTITEIGDYVPHNPEVEIPQMEPETVTGPSVEVITGTGDGTTPDTEEYVPIPLPDPDINPEPWISPNPDSDTFPSDYPYEPTRTPLPDEREAPRISHKSDPEIDPSTNPETTPTTNPETTPTTEETPTLEPETPTPAPPDTGDAPEPDVIVTPPIFNNGAGSLFTVYNPTTLELTRFGQWLWSTWSGNVTDTLQKLFLNHPLDGIISLHELYALPATGNNPVRENIKCGFLDSQIEATVVQARYTELNCGTMIIPEYWGNYFDYSPYTHVTCYLPFVGFVTLDADDIIGHSVNIKYKIDAFTGAVAALVTVAKNSYSALAYQFEGNAAVTLPLTSGNQNAFVSGLLSVAASGIGGLATGGLAGMATSMAASGIRAAGSAKASVAHSGGFGGTFGAMGIRKPYLIIKRPVQKEASNYRLDYGFPAHKRVMLSRCSGYVRVLEVNVVSATATNAEKQMIVDALKSGVYL